MSNNVDIGPRKTMFILVVVIGCFSVLWPKVFYPMLVGNANQQIKPNPLDKQSGCCDVISDSDVNTIKILIELCNNIVEKPNAAHLEKESITQCRKKVLSTCGIDIELVLHPEVRLGQAVKRILNEVRSFNGSLCLKYNYGVQPWRLGVPHRVTVNLAKTSSIRQERPAHMRPEMLHPALRERGRAIPASTTIPPRIVEGRPGPIPGMRPTIGGPGHVVPAPTKGTSTMSVVMPIYTIGIVIFFTYTLMKLMFKNKPIDSTTNGLYPPVTPDPNFRKQVFEAERNQYIPRHKDEITTKLGWKERDTRDIELDQLRRRLRETERQMERIITQMGSASVNLDRFKKTETQSNGTISNGTISNGHVKHQEQAEHDPTSVKVLGMEMTASCEGGQKWSRPSTPLIPTTPVPTEPVPPPQSIYLEGALPAQSQLLVSESATETETEVVNEDPAVVLSGKMTLSVISLDSLVDKVENGDEDTQLEKDVEEEIEEEEQIIIMSEDDEEKLEESKYTTASATTAAENQISEDEEQVTDEEHEDEIEED